MNPKELQEATKLLEYYYRLESTIDKSRKMDQSIDLVVAACPYEGRLKMNDLPDTYFYGVPPEVFEKVCGHLLEETREKLQALGVTGL